MLKSFCAVVFKPQRPSVDDWIIVQLKELYFQIKLDSFKIQTHLLGLFKWADSVVH